MGGMQGLTTKKKENNDWILPGMQENAGGKGSQEEGAPRDRGLGRWLNLYIGHKGGEILVRKLLFQAVRDNAYRFGEETMEKELVKEKNLESGKENSLKRNTNKKCGLADETTKNLILKSLLKTVWEN